MNEIEQLSCRIKTCIQIFKPDFSDINVLTEAASGAFLCTPILAAAGGAKKVVACGRNSKWGKLNSIEKKINTLAKNFGVENVIKVTDKDPISVTEDIDLVTNLNFVRPINSELIGRINKNGAISLMWAPWEFRQGEIDTIACKRHEIAIVATNEDNKKVLTYESVGLLAVKLLLEINVEILGLKILVIGSPPFGKHITRKLELLGAGVTNIDNINDLEMEKFLTKNDNFDAIVIAEHRFNVDLLEMDKESLPKYISAKKIPVVYICGVLSKKLKVKYKLPIHPSLHAEYGYMTLTTSYLGPKPVVDLHMAGLMAGCKVIKCRQMGMNIDDAVSESEKEGYGLKIAANN